MSFTQTEGEKKMKSLSRVQLFVTSWTVAYQAPPSMGFSRQEYWSGSPFASPGNLPDPEMYRVFCIAARCFLPGSAGKESACNAGDLDSILGWEDPLEQGKVTHSSILAWRIPRTV